MSVPSALLMSKHIGEERKATKEFLSSPAATAEYLSRGRWQRVRHLEYVSQILKEATEKPVFLIITMPPRHGKSELISHWTPVWFLKKYPHKRVILASYGADLAADFGGMVKETIEENSTELNLRIAQDTRSKSQWKIRGYGGGMLATGIGGSITGRGGDLLLIDDPIKSQKEALSTTTREAIKQWYKATFRTRLQPGGSIVILMTRWHEDDLAGYLIKKSLKHEDDSDPWQVINLPAIAGDNDPLGRQPGEALWPEQWPVASLRNIRTAISTTWFSAEFQGSPTIEGGGIIKRSWFGYYDELPIEMPCIQVWDTAYGQSDGNSYTACITVYFDGAAFYVADVWYGRPTFPELKEALKAKYYQYNPARVFIEAKASGMSLVQQIQFEAMIPVIPIPANEDKATRLHSVSGLVESGRVKLKNNSPWLEEFMYELTGFPAVARNDITDVFSHSLRMLMPNGEPVSQVVVYDSMPLVNLDL